MSEPVQVRSTRLERVQERVEWALILIGLNAYLWLLPHHVDGDGYARYETLQRLLDDGVVTGARYSIIQSLLAIPWYLAGMITGETRIAVARFNVVLFVAAIALLWWLLRKRMDARVLRRFILLLIAASMFPRHIQGFYGEVLTALGVMFGIIFYALGRRILGAVPIVVGVINTPAAIVGMAFVEIRRAILTKKWVRCAIPGIIAILLVMLEFYVRRGSPFTSGYDGDAGFPTVLPYSGEPGFSYPFMLGLISQLLSFGKGIIWFAPGVILHYVSAGAQMDALPRTIQRYSMLFSWGLIIAYAKWWSWYGGWYWGPRFLLYASIPAALALAHHATHSSSRIGVRITVLAVLALSCWVGICAAVYGQVTMEVCQQRDYQLEFMCWYVPEYSALIRPFVVGMIPESPSLQLMGAYVAIVFTVLALPLTRSLLIDLRRIVARLWRTYREGTLPQ